MTDHFDTETLEALAAAAVAGEMPMISPAVGRELRYALSLLSAPKKIFDTTDYDVIEMDVAHEGSQLSPDSEKLLISIGAGGQTRQIKIPASLSFMLVDLIQDAIPQD